MLPRNLLSASEKCWRRYSRECSFCFALATRWRFLICKWWWWSRSSWRPSSEWITHGNDDDDDVVSRRKTTCLSQKRHSLEKIYSTLSTFVVIASSLMTFLLVCMTPGVLQVSVDRHLKKTEYLFLDEMMMMMMVSVRWWRHGSAAAHDSPTGLTWLDDHIKTFLPLWCIQIHLNKASLLIALASMTRSIGATFQSFLAVECGKKSLIHYCGCCFSCSPTQYAHAWHVKQRECAAHQGGEICGALFGRLMSRERQLFSSRRENIEKSKTVSIVVARQLYQFSLTESVKLCRWQVAGFCIALIMGKSFDCITSVQVFFFIVFFFF